MFTLQAALKKDADSHELLRSTSRNLIYTTAALYLIWHFIATLSWPDIFSPRLWLSTLMMLTLVILSLRLLKNHYIIAQIFWLIGLTATILQAYMIFDRPEITLLFVFLPLMAIVTTGPVGTILIELVILFSLSLFTKYSLIPFLSPGYQIGILLGSIFTAIFGWGLSTNLLSALSSSAYHYTQARQLLEETRRHRAEISRIVKDQNQTNYQLERLNQMLYFARARAEEARDDRDRFILAVSHELRSPLNFILGFSDLMVNSPETYAIQENWPPGLYDDIREIYRSSTHLLGLINDILDLGQIDARQMTIFREKVKLEQIVMNVKEMTGPAFAQKDLWFEVESEDQLPFIFVDVTRIRQALLNLINNSLRFTDQGGVTVRIKREDNWILVEVADTGSGIASEDIPKVFDDFRQVGQDSWRRREGTGLGLSISRRFIQLHGGKMWLKSKLGQGTSFYFTLPVQELADESASSHLADPQGVSTRLMNKQVSQEQLVLLLTADPQASELLSQWMDGLHFLAVACGEELQAALKDYYPRALLVDQDSLNGEEALTQNLQYDLPIIHFSLPFKRDRGQSLPPGVSNYLVKPISRQSIIEAVKDLGDDIEFLLIVDDDPAMVRFVTMALKSENQDSMANGYKFISAFNGAEALQKLNEHKVDAILLDLDLPELNGWEVLSFIRKTPDFSQTPILIVSAVDMPQMLFGDNRKVLDITMRRPLNQNALAAILKSLLKNIQPVYPALKESSLRKQGLDSVD